MCRARSPPLSTPRCGATPPRASPGGWPRCSSCRLPRNDCPRTCPARSQVSVRVDLRRIPYESPVPRVAGVDGVRGVQGVGPGHTGSPRRRVAFNSRHRVYKVGDAAGTARSTNPYLRGVPLRGVPLVDGFLHCLPPCRRRVLHFLVEFIEEDIRAAAAADDTSVSAAAQPPAAHRQRRVAQLLQPLLQLFLAQPLAPSLLGRTSPRMSGKSRQRKQCECGWGKVQR